RHEAALLLFGAEGEDRRQRDAVRAEPDLDAHRLAREHQLLERHQPMAEVAAGAAERLGIADAEEARLRGLSIKGTRKALGFVPRMRVRGNFVLGEAADLRAEGGVLLVLE